MRKYFIVICLTLIACQAILAREIAICEKFESELDIGRILLINSGKNIALAHEKRSVTIIDSITLENLKTLKVDSPGPLLFRKGLLYVAENSTGLLKVFSAEKDWEFVDEVDMGLKNVALLSAPLEKYFKNVVIASSGNTTNWVDVEKDTHKRIRHHDDSHQPFESVQSAQFTADGRFVVDFGSNYSYVYTSEDYFNQMKRTHKVESDNLVKRSWQVGVGDIWFSSKAADYGNPPQRFMKELDVVIPDSDPKSNRCYTINNRDKTISVRQLDQGFAEIDIVSMPTSSYSLDRYYEGFGPDSDNRTYGQTVGGRVYLYLRSSRDQRLLVFHFPINPPIYSDKISEFRRDLPISDSYELVSGPKGIAISDDGLLSWSSKKKVAQGNHSVKIRLENKGALSFFRETFSVIERQQDGVLSLELAPNRLARIEGFEGVMVVDQNSLLPVNSKGKPAGRISFSGNYKDVIQAHDKKSFVALGEDSVDLIAENGKSILKSINLKGLKPVAIIPHASGNSYLVSTEDSSSTNVLETYPIVRVDFAKGDFEKQPKVFGKYIARNRFGDLLITGFHHREVESTGFLNQRVSHIDLFMNYRMSTRRIDAESVVQAGLKEMRSIHLSSDDNFLAVNCWATVSGRQFDYGWNLPIYSVDNFERPISSVALEGGIKDIDSHPNLPVFGVLTTHENDGLETTHLKFVNSDGSETRRWLPHGMELPSFGRKICFTPKGDSIFLQGRDPIGRTILKKIDLNLSDEEVVISSKGRNDPHPAFPVQIMVSDDGTVTEDSLSAGDLGMAQWQISDLQKINQSEIPSKYINSIVGPAVTKIMGEGGQIGTGFFVSRDGYVITAAHCLPSLGPPVVSGYFDLPFGRSNFAVKARIVDVDEELDLALLKIEVDLGTWKSRLRKGKPLQGEEVYVIGHPGVGDISLENTLTSGLVSSVNRKIEDQSFIQISAPVNPGNSGGPVFDTKSNVIGMVSMKAQLEGAAFAVPTATIVDFIERSAKKNTVEGGWAKLLDKGIQNAKAKSFSTNSEISYIKYSNGPTKTIVKNTEEPFTGVFVTTALRTGKIVHQAPYVDGFVNGNVVEFSRGGKQRKVQSFEKGYKHGKTIFYYDSGNIQREEGWHSNELHGFTRSFKDAPYEVKAGIFFKEGKPSGPQYTMDELTRVTQTAYIADGKSVASRQTSFSNSVPGDKLLEFVKASDIEMVKRLIEEKVGAIDRIDGTIGPIHVAVSSSFGFMVQEIINLGADVNLKDSKGHRPIDLELAKSNPEKIIIQWLIDAGAKTDGIDNEKLKVILQAAE